MTTEQTCFRDIDSSVAYVFWTREPTDDDWTVIHQPDPVRVRKLFEAPYRPRDRKALADGEENAFYALSLSGVGGRAMIQDWIEETVPRVQQNLREWFRDLTILLDRDINKTPDGIIPEGCQKGELFAAWPLMRLTHSVGRRQERGYEVPLRLLRSSSALPY
ncbi:MAG: type I-C CRISPR-associated protein Cas8c/Csd1 [Candidatus Zipacnadales bacterium]